MPARLQLDDRAIVRGYKAGLSSVVLGRKFGCDAGAIRRRLREAGVVMRPSAIRPRQAPDPKKFNAQGLTELIDGLLLGDGCIRRAWPGIVIIKQHPTRIGWLKLVQRRFAEIGIRSSISKPRVVKGGRKIAGNRKPTGDTTTVELRTLTYDVIEAHYARWYPGGKKHVPADLRLTPTVVTHWFCGDGGGGRAALMLFTNGFARSEVDLLAIRLTRYGLPAVVRLSSSGDPVLYLGANAARKFKREIWRLLPRCCRYKLAGVTPKPERPGRLTRRTVHAIRYGDPKSTCYRKLLVAHKVSLPMACDIRRGRYYAGYDLGSPR